MLGKVICACSTVVTMPPDDLCMSYNGYHAPDDLCKSYSGYHAPGDMCMFYSGYYAT